MTLFLCRFTLKTSKILIDFSLDNQKLRLSRNHNRRNSNQIHNSHLILLSSMEL